MIAFFIKTYGCQANVADSSHIHRYLQVLGCVPVDNEKLADFIIVNTCAIRKKAEDKMFSYLGELSQLKQKKLFLIIGVIGCVASYRKKEIFTRFPYISFVFSAREDIKKLKALITDEIESLSTKKKLFFEKSDIKSDGFKPSEYSLFKRSMINIMRGCNNYCSYCIVPFTTGRERSYPMLQILDEIKREVESGTKEITLLGQNVNSYQDPETGARFEILLQKVADIDGEFWVRFVSPHPKDMTNEVIDVIAEENAKRGALAKLCPYIHLPLQSGSNKILRLMNRTYTVEKFLDLVDVIKKRLPSATISTDIIVGFPQESEEDYLATRNVMDKVRFQMVYGFIYSPRKYTQAAQMVDDCSYEVKLRRLQDLQARHREIGTEINKGLVGETVRVLLESRCEGCYPFLGRTSGNVRVFVGGCTENLQINQFVDVVVDSGRLSDISGKVLATDGLNISVGCQNGEKSIK